MSKTDNLFVLIKSLTKSEKRYFRLNSQVQGSDPKYLMLFDCIDGLDKYCEDTIKSTFSREKFIRQLPVAKNYLSQLIMKSLRGFHLKELPAAQLKAALTDVEILFKKDLIQLSFQAIRKAERFAQKAGDELAQLQVLNWKRKILLNLKDRSEWKSELDDLVMKEQELLKNLKTESQLWELTLGIDRGSSSNLEALPDHPLLQDEAAAGTYRSKILYFHLKYISHVIGGRPGDAEAVLDRMLEFLEQDELRLRDDPGPYISALNNKIGIYLNQHDYSQVHSVLDTIRELPERINLAQNNPVSLKIMIRTFNVELETYRDSGDFTTGIAMIPQVRAYMDENWELIATDYKVLLHYQFAYLYFMVGDFSQALKDVNKVLDQRYRGIRGDIIAYAQFLNLIIHYELGNNTVLKYGVDSSRRYLKKRGKLQEFEKILLQLFSRVCTRPHEQHRQLFSKAYNKLFGEDPLINENQLDYLDFKSWLSAKTNTKRAPRLR